MLQVQTPLDSLEKNKSFAAEWSRKNEWNRLLKTDKKGNQLYENQYEPADLDLVLHHNSSTDSYSLEVLLSPA